VRKFWKVAAVTGVAVTVGMMTSIGSAFATPPTGYGFDGQPHAVVGAGSDTTYQAQLGLTKLYMSTAIGGCQHLTAVDGNLNKCQVTGSPEVDTNLGNYQGDTFAQANPTGSSAGIASLNGNPNSATSDAGTIHPVNYTCAGTATVITTTGPNADYARSSRGPKTSGGASPCSGNELDNDTFWGYGQDGIQVIAFDATRGAELQAQASPSLTPNQLFNIWNCSGGTGTGGRMRWSDVIPSLASTPRGNVDIVPWGMNASAGTFASFQSYIANNASGVPVGWSPDGQACDRKLTSGLFPLENDLKPMLHDPATLSTDPSSADNPDNWLAWGSFGVMSAFPFLSSVNIGGTQFQAVASPINGVLPSSARIIANTYPIGRTIYHVTLKRDADCVKTSGACDFVGHPGPALPTTGTDLNVTGGASGVSGAIREFTRFLCRGSATQHGLNPYSGTNNFSEITTAVNNAGFTVVPSALRTSGSRCQVLS
jgi:hypothetical protein